MGLPNTFCSIHPTFKVKDWSKANALASKLSAVAATESKCIYYGWVKNTDENLLFCQEAYVDGEGINDHVASVGGTLGEALEAGDVMELLKAEVHGPAEELEKTKAVCDAWGVKYFVTLPNGTTTLSAMTSDEKTSPRSMCAIYPVFTVLNADKAKEAEKKMCDLAATESGCLYYGWTQEGDTLHCREAYKDSAGVLAHLENVGSVLSEALDSGTLKLEFIWLLGPKEELEKCKEAMDPFGTKYFETVMEDGGGFSRYKA